jgi:hypothetical protein
VCKRSREELDPVVFRCYSFPSWKLPRGAWAEGAVEADVEAIKRSMNLTSIRRESLALNNLAVDLSVAEGTHGLGAFAFAVSGVPSQ